MRVGIIGLGRVAVTLENDPYRGKPATHLGAWLGNNRVQVVAGCDPDQERRAAFAALVPGARVYADYADMLRQEQPELVSVCGYATERADMVIACAQAGVKGIWCEKAVACSLAEIDCMQKALETAGTRLIVSFMRRWDARYQTVARLIGDGAIGRVESISTTFSSNLIHTGTHAFDAMEMMCGPIASVQAWLEAGDGYNEQSGYKFDTTTAVRDVGGFANLVFENGVRGVVHGMAKRYFRFEFEIIGSEGLIRLGNQTAELYGLTGRDLYEGITGIFPMEFPPVQGANGWHQASNNLIDAVQGVAVEACGINEGRRSLQVALAMHQSHFRDHAETALTDVSADVYVPSR